MHNLSISVICIIRTAARPELLLPFASAIDEPGLKVPEEMVRGISSLFHLWIFDVRNGDLCVSV